ncbi:hypothetical protein ACWCQV_41045, partial [Streptomyces eurythermus]
CYDSATPEIFTARGTLCPSPTLFRSGGALATVAGTVAVIAALSGSGSPDGARPARGDRVADAPTAHGDGTGGESTGTGADGEGAGTGGEGAVGATPTTVPSASAPAAAARSAVVAPTGTTTRSAAPPPGTTASGPDGARPATTAPSADGSATPTATTSPTVSPDFRPGGPHHGHGGPRWHR